MRPAHEWRVTRYDPARRDDRGAYPANDWTSVHDVGKAFEGKVLTLAEYERIEGLYLDAAMAFAQESQASDLAFRQEHPGEQTFEVGELAPIVQSMLREERRGFIEAVGGPTFSIYIGFDLYMYIGSDARCGDAVTATEAAGLFAEPFQNPYLETAASEEE